MNDCSFSSVLFLNTFHFITHVVSSSYNYLSDQISNSIFFIEFLEISDGIVADHQF